MTTLNLLELKHLKAALKVEGETETVEQLAE